ncbi:IAA acetyltransferase [Candidatus Rhodobacter oscarellae]|uniref:IAA acetyltransferase n=1 Tax=Candidatus Rhodobacter oscarellae TaxID=1675527 RepID=A0A0J9ECY2_9RHOB|nr:GNAT family N-acetyltransferase [Candidatus Rhodobacter lobularis]KMW60541.1 IAA acetyltransferase [Candidatus Rhodobacter lobularis]
MIRVTEGDPRHPEAEALLKASHALMQELFPAEANHFLSVDALCAPEISFFHALKGETVIGTGALANKGDYGEVKSMFTASEARGTGAAGAILQAIETKARAMGLPVLRLETGDTLHAAHRLYERHGFTYRGPFGEYLDDPTSLFMEKPLT